jgi:hypothetical protein
MTRLLQRSKCHVVGHGWGGYAIWELMIHLLEQFHRHVADTLDAFNAASTR